MGIVYVAAAFLVVPGLLLLFHRLSRPPALHIGGSDDPLPGQPGDDRWPVHPARWEPPAEGPQEPAGWVIDGSVADEAERWLRTRR